LVRVGDADTVRAAAEDLKAQGDAMIARALDGDALTYYASLYPSAAYELAVMYMGQSAAEASDGKERTRFAKLAVNAEERAVRVSTALHFALVNLDGTWIPQHRRQIRQVRENEGEDAARLKASDLIENQLFYPRSFLPILLNEPSPPETGS
jgi:hypothetical protein